MKKVLLLTTCISTLSVGAQNWVDTTAQSKKVILEEFTGMYCGYCPDGHRTANQIVANNPGKVFLINIHSGGFAQPKTGDPDMRTPAGDVIDGAAGITGYPAGSVNRSTNPWAKSRSDWSNMATGILAQTSPVNVKVKAFVDMNTRILTTEVEVFYTANSATAKNYLTIALTQDDILGHQTDYGDYNPTNWIDGSYRHNHVLRQLITAGNYGEAIDTTTKGHYLYRKYTTTIPESYKNVKVVLHKLHVVAFVAEGNNNILSGDGVDVNFDENLKTDLAITDKTVNPGICATSITPSVEVTNTLTQPVTEFTVTATVNQSKYSKTITTPLDAGAKTLVTWEPVTLNGGSYSYAFSLKDSITGTGGKALLDVEIDNDNLSSAGYAFQAAAIPANNVWCGFETINNTALDLSVKGQALVPTGTSFANNYGCWSKSALLFYLHSSWNVNGKPASVLLGNVNLTNLPKPGMAYTYAYSDGNLGGTAPVITVEISKDCGATWTQVSSITAEETGEPNDPNNLYIPDPGAYKLVKVDLDAFKTNQILAKVSVTPGSNGNSLYLDEISFNSYASLGVKNRESELQFDVYPNPASGNFTINVKESGNASYILTDISGKQIESSGLTGEETVVNCEKLQSGIYFVEVNAGGSKSTRKIVITR